MILAFAEYTADKNYRVALKFRDKIRSQLDMLSDTGAIETVIPLMKMFNIVNRKEYSETLNSLNDKETDSKVKSFGAANGTSILGYPVCLQNVSVGAIKLPELHVFLTDAASTCPALLGNNFTHSCKYSHEVGGNIIYSEFSYQHYCSVADKYYFNSNTIRVDMSQLTLADKEQLLQKFLTELREKRKLLEEKGNKETVEQILAPKSLDAFPKTK